MTKKIQQIYDAFIAKRFPDKDANDPYLDKWVKIFVEGYEWQQSDYESRRVLQEVAPIIYPKDLNEYFIREDKTPKKTFKKVTVGFVIQDYETLPDGTAVCVGQDFIAGNDVTYENKDGEPLNDDMDINTDDEVYCPIILVQPKKLVINPIKWSYEGGLCPDCQEDIPDDVVDGQGCKYCDHVFCLPRPDDA
jgi:hypothetical protein